MKVFYKILVLVFIFSFIPIAVLAHSGGTDSQGGHTNHSTGEYHFHHGYSAHQHPGGVCPYEEYNSDSSTENSNYFDLAESAREAANEAREKNGGGSSLEENINAYDSFRQQLKTEGFGKVTSQYANNEYSSGLVSDWREKTENMTANEINEYLYADSNISDSSTSSPISTPQVNAVTQNKILKDEITALESTISELNNKISILSAEAQQQEQKHKKTVKTIVWIGSVLALLLILAVIIQARNYNRLYKDLCEEERKSRKHIEQFVNARDEKASMENQLRVIYNIDKDEEILNGLERIKIEKQNQITERIPVLHSDFLIPSGTEIGEDGLPREIGAKHHWGSKYTVYVTSHGKMYHKRGCKTGTHAMHIFKAMERYHPCSQCRPDTPSAEWYIEYLNLIQLEKKYKK